MSHEHHSLIQRAGVSAASLPTPLHPSPPHIIWIHLQTSLVERKHAIFIMFFSLALISNSFIQQEPQKHTNDTDDFIKQENRE